MKAVATPEVVEAMRQQVSPTSLEDFWRKLFLGQIPEHLPVADPLQSNELELEGHKLIVVNTGKTDTAESTCLHVPSVGLLVGGDTVYNGIHPCLAETNTESRREWIDTLDKLETLTPEPSLLGTRFQKMKTSLASSPRRGSIFATSIVWMNPPPPSANFVMPCLNSTLIAQIPAPYGAARRLVKRVPSG
ncbi:hypothetical protein HDF14_003111 [Edaphobacter lichenicola]|uniref:Metallo-beta-lactamase domain-containing protein n=1 Tax=Tunturiibacter gelidiferens TaxID=3069689 RepID=A0A9X0QFL8_9BACT|nr:hypothetical protein [Edaphobacter lichenicola]